MKIQFHANCNTSSSVKPASIAGKVGMTVFFLFFFGMGSLFEVFLIRELVLTAKSWTWPKVDCVIVSSSVEENGNRDTPYVFKIKYEYSHEGKLRCSEKYQDSITSFGDYAKAQKLSEQYSAGSKTFCHVNPENPEEAVLKLKSLWLACFIPLPALFILIGAGGIYGTWFYRNGKKTAPPKASHSAKNKKLGKSGLLLLGLVFLAAGLAMSYFLLIRPLTNIYRAQNWPETPCKIISGRVQSHDSDDGTTYSVDILYEYSLNGKTYRSNRYDFIGGSSSGYNGKKETVDRYLAMKNPVCHVDPADPHQAVLVRKLTWKYAICLLPLVFVMAGLWVSYLGISRIVRQKLQKQEWMPRPAYAGHGPENGSEYRNDTESGDSIVLKTQTPTFYKFIGMILICLFWNGILTLFLGEMIRGFRVGRPEWFLTFFLIPFEIVGICLIGGVIYQFLALFNPRFKLTLRRSPLYPGSTGELDWTIRGRAQRIRSLTITLRGREEATYRRGTTTCTDKSTFFEKQLFASQAFQEIGDGHAKFEIPTDTMHSFEAENNKIIWEIEVHGDIPRWPDVKQEHRIIINPIRNT